MLLRLFDSTQDARRFKREADLTTWDVGHANLLSSPARHYDCEDDGEHVRHEGRHSESFSRSRSSRSTSCFNLSSSTCLSAYC